MINKHLLVALQTEKENNRVYTLLVPYGAPYNEAYDAAIELSGEILVMGKEAEEHAKKAKEEVVAEIVEPAKS